MSGIDLEDDDFQQKFCDSLGNQAVEVGRDISEVSLDALVTTTPGILQSIPIAGLFVAAGKIGMAVRDYRFAKKLIVFLNEFNNGSIDDSKLNDFRKMYNEDKGFRTKIVENLCAIVDRLFDEEKAKINSRLFRAHVNGAFDWNYFRSLSLSLEQLNPSGYGGLKEMYHSTHEPKGNLKSVVKKHAKGFTLGTPAPDYEGTLISAGLATRNWAELALNRYGVSLYEHGFKDA